MKILVCMVSIEGESSIYRCDAIQYDGKFWLVPKWLDPLPEQKTMPERIILMDGLTLQKLSAAFRIADLILKDPMPREILFGAPSSQSNGKFVVIYRPRLSPGLSEVQ